jgi:syntaxin-binding protein 5
MPEAPKQSFFKNLFNIGSAVIDREELFGEAGSGKAAKGVAKYTSGIGQAQESAGSAMSEIGRAKQAALERGEKLSELEERTVQMRNEAEEYSKLAQQLKAKYRDKKWYQL